MGTPEQLDLDPAVLADWLAEGRDLQLIDVREPYEREAGHIAGTRHIELLQLSAQAATVERERPVVFYCRVGSRSEHGRAGVPGRGLRGILDARRPRALGAGGPAAHARGRLRCRPLNRRTDMEAATEYPAVSVARAMPSDISTTSATAPAFARSARASA